MYVGIHSTLKQLFPDNDVLNAVDTAVLLAPGTIPIDEIGGHLFHPSDTPASGNLTAWQFARRYLGQLVQAVEHERALGRISRRAAAEDIIE